MLLYGLVAVLAPADGLVGVAVAWLVTSIVVAGGTVWHVVAVLRTRGVQSIPRAAGDHR